MAFFDWNNDGKKDFTDDLIEYHIYKQSMENNKSKDGYVPRYSRGISTFRAVVAVIGGLFLAAAVIALFGGGENTPVILIIFLWIFCSSGLSVWFDSVGF